jgi:hypothetical protein
MRDRDAKEVLLEIANCEIARNYFDGPVPGHPCSTVIAAQGAPSWDQFQVPEPWSGNLLKAPILFLGSNPSIFNAEEYPRGASTEPQLENFFNSRFEGHWMRDNRARKADGTYGKKVPYWSSIQGRAAELLGRAASPGVDYVLSEIVHCKSISEVGVTSALNFCAGRYMVKLLCCSGAAVVVLVGRKALRHWNSLEVDALQKVPHRDGTEEQEIAGRKRIFLFLAHPSGPEPKLFRNWVSAARMRYIRSFIEGNASRASDGCGRLATRR